MAPPLEGGAHLGRAERGWAGRAEVSDARPRPLGQSRRLAASGHSRFAGSRGSLAGVSARLVEATGLSRHDEVSLPRTRGDAAVRSRKPLPTSVADEGAVSHGCPVPTRRFRALCSSRQRGEVGV